MAHNFNISGTLVVFALKNGHQINIKDFPRLQELGEWPPINDQTNLRLVTKLGKPELVKRFTEITGLSSDQFDCGALSGLNGIW